MERPPRSQSKSSPAHAHLHIERYIELAVVEANSTRLSCESCVSRGTYTWHVTVKGLLFTLDFFLISCQYNIQHIRTPLSIPRRSNEIEWTPTGPTLKIHSLSNHLSTENKSINKNKSCVGGYWPVSCAKINTGNRNAVKPSPKKKSNRYTHTHQQQHSQMSSFREIKFL